MPASTRTWPLRPAYALLLLGLLLTQGTSSTAAVTLGQEVGTCQRQPASGKPSEASGSRQCGAGADTQQLQQCSSGGCAPADWLGARPPSVIPKHVLPAPPPPALPSGAWTPPTPEQLKPAGAAPPRTPPPVSTLVQAAAAVQAHVVGDKADVIAAASVDGILQDLRSSSSGGSSSAAAPVAASRLEAEDLHLLLAGLPSVTLARRVPGGRGTARAGMASSPA